VHNNEVALLGKREFNNINSASKHSNNNANAFKLKIKVNDTDFYTHKFDQNITKYASLEKQMDPRKTPQVMHP